MLIFKYNDSRYRYADICTEILEKLKAQNIPVLCVHDCFKVPYPYAKQLDEAILIACREFMDENFLENRITNNIKTTSHAYYCLEQLSEYRDKLLTNWIKDTMPELRILYNCINKLARLKKFTPPLIENEHVMWKMDPPLVIPFSKSLYNKDYWLQKYDPKEMEYRKVGSGFLANYIELGDAIICTKIVEKLKAKNIPVLCVHDCFKVPYPYAADLQQDILSSCVEFMDSNYLEKKFKDTPATKNIRGF